MHKFSTQAMNTTMDLSIDGCTQTYAASAADNLFWILKELESRLSMFLNHSEIYAINCMKIGDTQIVHPTTAEILAGAMYLSSLTKGVLDVCKGEYFLNAKNIQKFENPRTAKIAFNPENFVVQKIEDGLLDLGAVGKGFAVDVLAQEITEVWELNRALFSFGGSSILALDPPEGKDSWELTFAGQKLDDFAVKNCAIGASGTAIQGRHIVNCQTGKFVENAPFRVWVMSDSGLLADGFSTAFMMMPRDEIKEIAALENLRVAIQQNDGDKIEIIY